MTCIRKIVGFLTGRLGRPDTHIRFERRLGLLIKNMFQGVTFVKFRGLWTDGLPSGEPLVVKIIMGVGYPFRRPIVVISEGWLPLWVVGCLLLFCFGAWFPKAEPGMIFHKVRFSKDGSGFCSNRLSNWLDPKSRIMILGGPLTLR